MHNLDVTQILVLTDFCSRLSFVTLSLDGELKLWNEDGQLESQGSANG